MSAVERRAARAVEVAIARLADRLGEALPAASVEPGADHVAVVGARLKRRQLVDPALRWPAGLLR